jgi:hypothetical protein
MEPRVLTNLRDKLILVAMILFGLGCLILIALGHALEGTLTAIITGMFGIYKGTPTPPTETKTTETTISSTISPEAAAAKQTT